VVAQPRPLKRVLAGLTLVSLTLLLIEFLDELVFGAREAAWPLIRHDLRLQYVQIGLVLSLPGIVSVPIEPLLGILGDVWKRRVLILGGGAVFTLSLLLLAGSQSFLLLLLASLILYPASGSFVSLSQATLMDLDPTRHEQSMARWVFAGSAGAVLGPLLLAGAASLGFTWRAVFAGIAALSLALLILAWRRIPSNHRPAKEPITLREGIKGALAALRRWEVVRWLVLLDCSDLMLDVLLGYLALYFADVAEMSARQAGIAVAVWTAMGFLGSLLLIPFLERVPGLPYVRISAALEMALFPAFLLVPGVVPKLTLLGLVALVNAGWYPVLQGQLYSAMPDQSGTVMALGAIFSLVGALIPLALGLVAQRFGLTAALWFILLAPLALLAGLPRGSFRRDSAGD
jgi:FSR family fosmidomycin resistance protein-like MFS transporter